MIDDFGFLFKNYADGDSIWESLCSSCKRDIYQVKICAKKKEKFPNLSIFEPQMKVTRSKDNSNCKISKIARSILTNFSCETPKNIVAGKFIH